MAQNSIDTSGREIEGAIGKPIFAYALYQYQSKWLDSLAKARHKVHEYIINHAK
jgi:hypothetical protein